MAGSLLLDFSTGERRAGVLAACKGMRFKFESRWWGTGQGTVSIADGVAEREDGEYRRQKGQDGVTSPYILSYRKLVYNEPLLQPASSSQPLLLWAHATNLQQQGDGPR
jgi:hypothetical protein